MSVTGNKATTAGRSTLTRLERSASSLQVENTLNNTTINNTIVYIDDSISLPTGLQQDRDFTFSERAGCNNGTDTVYCIAV